MKLKESPELTNSRPDFTKKKTKFNQVRFLNIFNAFSQEIFFEKKNRF